MQHAEATQNCNSPLELPGLGLDANVKLVMADEHLSPHAEAAVCRIYWSAYGIGHERVLWLCLEDGRTFGVVWEFRAPPSEVTL